MNEKILEEMKKKDPLFAKLFKNIKAGVFKTKKVDKPALNVNDIKSSNKQMVFPRTPQEMKEYIKQLREKKANAGKTESNTQD